LQVLRRSVAEDADPGPFMTVNRLAMPFDSELLAAE